MYLFIHSLVPSKDGYWALDGDWMAGIIHMRLSVLCEKEAWLSGWLLVMKMASASRWNLAVADTFWTSTRVKRVTSGSGPHSLGVCCIPSARRPGWSTERRGCCQEIVGLRKQFGNSSVLSGEALWNVHRLRVGPLEGNTPGNSSIDVERGHSKVLGSQFLKTDFSVGRLSNFLIFLPLSSTSNILVA